MHKQCIHSLFLWFRFCTLSEMCTSAPYRTTVKTQNPGKFKKRVNSKIRLILFNNLTDSHLSHSESREVQRDTHTVRFSGDRTPRSHSHTDADTEARTRRQDTLKHTPDQNAFGLRCESFNCVFWISPCSHRCP